MSELRILQIVLPNRFSPQAYMGKKQSRAGKRLIVFFVCIMTAPILMCGCSHFSEESMARSTFKEASDLFSRGSYQASLGKYQQIMEKYPSTRDKVLFEMGIVYSHPKNEQKDHLKSLECLQKLIRDYPESRYRQDSEMMIFYIKNVTAKDMIITAQQKQIEALRDEIKSKDNETIRLKNNIGDLEKKFITFAIQNGSADKILIEKKQRRLMLVSKGEVIKTYRIALGGNPDGPKIRHGDDKTPEGTYVIDARNKDSDYHLSLHISYPNERDKKRAKELGVSPGGDIMIHGIKNGFSGVGALHAEVDWTKGCIAVTNEEIDEISKLTRNGTVVEIRP